MVQCHTVQRCRCANRNDAPVFFDRPVTCISHADSHSCWCGSATGAPAETTQPQYHRLINTMVRRYTRTFRWLQTQAKAIMPFSHFLRIFINFFELNYGNDSVSCKIIICFVSGPIKPRYEKEASEIRAFISAPAVAKCDLLLDRIP